MSLNQVTVTDRGLLNINRKIIDERKFSQSLLTTVGSPKVEGALVSKFSSTSYFTKDNLSFKGGDLTIIFEGTYLSSLLENNETAWYLSAGVSGLFLQFIDNHPQVKLPSGNVISFDYLTLEDETHFKVITSIKHDPEEVEVIINIGTDVFKKTKPLSSPIDTSLFTSLTIGNNPNFLNFFWEGLINLEGFSILEDGITKFTPTTGYSLNFSRIVVSDGKYPLTDTPVESLKHSYTYNISEITRSSNTVLLVSELDESSHLVIREIGLYAYEYIEGEGNKEFLFGYIKNLNIDKGAEVPYELILTVDLAISIVNVVGFPNSDSFILEDITPALLKEFISVRNSNSYLIGNLERLIRMNSLKTPKTAGYNERSLSITKNEVPPLYNAIYMDGIGCCGYRMSNGRPLLVSPDRFYAWYVQVDGNKKFIYTKTESNPKTLYNRLFGIVENSEDGFHIMTLGGTNYVVYGPQNERARRDAESDRFTPAGKSEKPLQCPSIGYNTPQVTYKEQKLIDEQQDCYSSVQTYSKLHKRLQPSFKAEFNPLSLVMHNIVEPEVSEKGEFSDFSSAREDYMEPSLFLNKGDWTFDLAITVNEVSASERSILNLGAYDSEKNYSSLLTISINPSSRTLKVNDELTDYHFKLQEKRYIQLVYKSGEEKVYIYAGSNKRELSLVHSSSMANLALNSIIIGARAYDYYFEDEDSHESFIATPYLDLYCSLCTFHLLEWSFTQADNDWVTYEDIFMQDTKLLQYYHFPVISKNSYVIHDINNPEYLIDVLDGTFTGNKDFIDLNRAKGLSLCLKVNLINDDSKLILAKVGSEGEILISIEFIKEVSEADPKQIYHYFKFTFLTNEGSQVFTSSLMNPSVTGEYTKNPFLLSIVMTESKEIFVYTNNKLILSEQLSLSLPNYNGSYMTNILTGAPNIGKYIKDIIVVEGPITTEQLYYLTNLTDTNFKFILGDI